MNLPRLHRQGLGLVAVLTVVLAAVFLLAGQGRSEGEAPGRPEPSPGIESPRTLLVLNVTGGIAGVDELVIVRPSGVYLVDNGRDPTARGRLSGSELDELVRVVQNADLGREDGVDEDLCCDRVFYTYTYGGASYRTVQGLVPERVEALQSLLAGIASRSGAGLIVGS